MTKELGNYETSYFIMNVPTKADLEIRNMSIIIAKNCLPVLHSIWLLFKPLMDNSLILFQIINLS